MKIKIHVVSICIGFLASASAIAADGFGGLMLAINVDRQEGVPTPPSVEPRQSEVLRSPEKTSKENGAKPKVPYVKTYGFPSGGFERVKKEK